MICEDCFTKDPSNAFIELSLGELSEFEKQTFYVHFYKWEFKSVWAKEVDDDESCEGCSRVIGLVSPDPIDGSYNFEESFRGEEPT